MTGPYYPQGALTLRVLWEDFGAANNAKLQEVYSISVLARNLTVNINDYTQADTFSAEIDYKQFPFDPRSIRACGVTISMQDMGQLFARGRDPIELLPSSENTIFSGFADTESISFDDNSRTVKLEGRDFTGILIDRPWLEEPPDLARPLDIILQQMLSNLEQTKELKIKNLVEGPLPTLAQFSNSFSPNSTVKSGKKNESYWDVMQDLISRAGLIGYIEIDQLVISKPRVLYDAKKALNFVYGKNLKNLEFKRKLGRRKNFNIHVLSLNPESKEEPLIEAKIPAEATDDWAKEIGIKKEEVKIPTLDVKGNPSEAKPAPYIAFRVPNITSKDHLINVGQELYEELSRQEIEGSFVTRDMEAMDDLDKCINLLKMRNGTPLQIVIEQGDMQGLSQQKSAKDKARFLIERCYSNKIAVALAEVLTNARLTGPFYTKSVEFSLGAESGFEIKVEFVNFIQVPKNLGGST